LRSIGQRLHIERCRAYHFCDPALTKTRFNNRVCRDALIRRHKGAFPESFARGVKLALLGIGAVVLYPGFGQQRSNVSE